MAVSKSVSSTLSSAMVGQPVKCYPLFWSRYLCTSTTCPPHSSSTMLHVTEKPVMLFSTASTRMLRFLPQCSPFLYIVENAWGAWKAASLRPSWRNLVGNLGCALPRKACYSYPAWWAKFLHHNSPKSPSMISKDCHIQSCMSDSRLRWINRSFGIFVFMSCSSIIIQVLYIYCIQNSTVFLKIKFWLI